MQCPFLLIFDIHRPTGAPEYQETDLARFCHMCFITCLPAKAYETDLANTCGMFSRYWKHVKTPMFVITSQWNQHDFDQVTCNVDKEDEDFVTYQSGMNPLNHMNRANDSFELFTAWRHGVTTLIQVMSLQQPANGWFVPNCHDETLFLATESIEQRKNVQVPLFTNGESKNLFQVNRSNHILIFVRH